MNTTNRVHILAIHSHPDDVEIVAGGTLALLAAEGHDITIVTMTPGDCGSTERTSEEIMAVRGREAASAAALIGAAYQCAQFRDLAIFNDDASRRHVTEVLRRIRPTIVLTAPPIDYLTDHEHTSTLVRDACFASSVPLYVTGEQDFSPAIAGHSPPLFYGSHRGYRSGRSSRRLGFLCRCRQRLPHQVRDAGPAC